MLILFYNRYKIHKYFSFCSGVFGTIIMGAICTHCMHVLVQCSHELCIRSQRPALSFAEVVEDSFASGPVSLRPYAKTMK